MTRTEELLAEHPYLFVKWVDDPARVAGVKKALLNGGAVKRIEAAFPYRGMPQSIESEPTRRPDGPNRIDRIHLDVRVREIGSRDGGRVKQRSKVLAPGSQEKLRNLLRSLDLSSAVEWVEPVKWGYFPMDPVPDDPYFHDLAEPDGRSRNAWHQGYEDLWGLYRIHAPGAWTIMKGDPGVIVGVVDTGVDYLHEDLRGRLWVNPGEDLNRNGKADFEIFYDTGSDGRWSKDEPGYDPNMNPDPSEDDYHPLYKPSGTEGNGQYDHGEPFDDDGMDRIPDTADPGEGDGVYNTYDPGDPISDIDFRDNDGYWIGGVPTVDDLLGWDFASHKAVADPLRYGMDNDPRDGYGHGTHVTGTIGATGDNGTGIAGLNWRSPILTCKAFSESGGSTSESLANALIYAVDHGAGVINNSWGGIEHAHLTEEAIQYAYEREVPLVFASGNFAIDSTTLAPQRDHRLILVTASSQDDTPCPFSCFGVNTDVSAPGGGVTDERLEAYNILSCLAHGSHMASIDFHGGVFAVDWQRKYLRAGGTSMACPHVTGVISLIQSQYAAMLAEEDGAWLPSHLTVEELRQILRTSADDDQENPGWDPYHGFGRVNAHRALKALEGTPWPGVAVSHISRPATRDNLTYYPDKTVLIEGLAYNRQGNPVEYHLDCGRGEDPDDWTPIPRGTLINGRFSTLWDASDLGEGIYTIRLTVVDSGGRPFKDRLLFTVSPPFLGRAWPLGLPSRNFFGAPLIEDVVPDAPGKEIILAASTGIHVLKESGEAPRRTSWPVLVAELPEFTDNPDFSHPELEGNVAVGDFDPSRPGNEILAFVRCWDSRGTGTDRDDQVLYWIYVFESDGTPVRDGTWPLLLRAAQNTGTHMTSGMILEDVNVDGLLEIVLVDQSRIKIFDLHGKDLAQKGSYREVRARFLYGSNVCVGDIDADHLGPEMVVSLDNGWQEPGHIVALNREGTQILKIDLDTRQPKPYRIEAVGLASLDGDSELEICVVCYAHSGTRGYYTSLHAFNADGSPVPGRWPYTSDEFGTVQLFLEPTVHLASADLDLDGRSEVLYSASSSIHVVRRDGTSFLEHRLQAAQLESGMVIGDLDGDGSPEIIANSLFSSIFAWTRDGKILDGWPFQTQDLIMTPPALGDVNGDGDLELVVMDSPLVGTFTSQRPFHVYAFDTRGDAPAPWPMHRGNARATNAPTEDFIRGDTNGNGKIDLGDVLVILGYLFWEVQTPVSPSAIDVNGDGRVQLADVMHLLVYLFSNGPEPAQPFPLGNVPPVISDVRTSVNPDGTVTVWWRTDERSTSTVLHGRSWPAANCVSVGGFVTDHAVTLESLEAAKPHRFAVVSEDSAGNLRTDDNGGRGYTFLAGELVLDEARMATGKMCGLDTLVPDAEMSLAVKVRSVLGDFRGLTARLRCDSPLVSLRQGRADLGDIAEGHWRSNSANPFVFVTIHHVEEDKKVVLYVDLYDGEGERVETFELERTISNVYVIGPGESPAISGTLVVWERQVDDRYRIYGRDLSGVTGSCREFPICPVGSCSQHDPAVCGTLVVWEDYRRGPCQIFAKDLAGQLNDGREFAVSEATYAQYDPAVSGTVVVWQGYKHGRAHIYGRDIAGLIEGGTTFSLSTEEEADQIRPSIGGTLVVWQLSHGGRSQIMARDLSGTIRAGIEFCVAQGTYPAVSEHMVVWIHNHQIHARPVSGLEFEVSRDSLTRHSIPAVVDCMVAWEDLRNGSQRVYVRDVTGGINGGEEFPVSLSLSGAQVHPAISKTVVVWEEAADPQAYILGKPLR